MLQPGNPSYRAYVATAIFGLCISLFFPSLVAHIYDSWEGSLSMISSPILLASLFVSGLFSNRYFGRKVALFVSALFVLSSLFGSFFLYNQTPVGTGEGSGIILPMVMYMIHAACLGPLFIISLRSLGKLYDNDQLKAACCNLISLFTFALIAPPAIDYLFSGNLSNSHPMVLSGIIIALGVIYFILSLKPEPTYEIKPSHVRCIKTSYLFSIVFILLILILGITFTEITLVLRYILDLDPESFAIYAFAAGVAFFVGSIIQRFFPQNITKMLGFYLMTLGSILGWVLPFKLPFVVASFILITLGLSFSIPRVLGVITIHSKNYMSSSFGVLFAIAFLIGGLSTQLITNIVQSADTAFATLFVITLITTLLGKYILRKSPCLPK